MKVFFIEILLCLIVSCATPSLNFSTLPYNKPDIHDAVKSSLFMSGYLLVSDDHSILITDYIAKQWIMGQYRWRVICNISGNYVHCKIDAEIKTSTAPAWTPTDALRPDIASSIIDPLRQSMMQNGFVFSE